MSALQKNNGFGPGKGSLGTVAIFGAVLVVASLYSLSRALNKSGITSGDASASSGATVPAQTNLITQEEIDSQHAMYRPPELPVQVIVAVPPAVAPTNQNNDEVVLRRKIAQVNQQIVERMQQYVRDNPSRDTRKLEEQIKKRESQCAPIQ